MPIDPRRSARSWAPALLAAALAAGFGSAHAAEGAVSGAHWRDWQAHATATDLHSLQRGARDFVSYCLGCHSLRYERWSRLGEDLRIPKDVLIADLIPPGQKPADYIMSPMPRQDAVKWFGKAPPDLSLIARYKGTNYLYRYLKTFYVDSGRATGANNLAYPNVAMPDVLSPLEGLKVAVYRTVNVQGAGGKVITRKVFAHFRQIAPGSLTPQQYDRFVRDTVNFLYYVSDPQRAERHRMGIWVILFLLAFTWLAWLLKREYWKDVR